MRSFGTVLFGLFLALTNPGAAAPQPASPVRPPHPAVDPAESCEGCHARVTPAVHAAWAGSRHAAATPAVGCVACHGTPEADFKVRPGASICAACHADQAAGPASDLPVAGRTCFTCHPPHALSPHRRPAPPQQAMPVR